MTDPFKALLLEQSDGKTVARLAELAQSDLMPGEVTVDVEWSTLNYKDALAITGSAPVGTEITTEDGKAAGTLFTQSGGHALAYLRFDRATGPMQAGDAQLSAA